MSEQQSAGHQAKRATKHDGRTTQTRTHILRLAEQMYYGGGYAGISLQDLASQLGITKAALFHHFKSKQDLFFATLLAMLGQREQRIEAAIAAEPGTQARLRAILLALAECPFFDPMKFLTDEHGKLSPDQQREIEMAFARAIQGPIARVLVEGVAAGALRPHRTMLGVMLFLNLAMLLPSPGHPNPRLASHGDLPAYVDELLTCFLSGVGRSNSPAPSPGHPRAPRMSRARTADGPSPHQTL